MDFYPIMIDLHRRPCTVIGGGTVAERKVAALLAAGAHVKVVSPVLTPALQAWVAQGRITVVARSYEDGDLSGSFLAVSATDDMTVNRRASKEAAQHHILLNVVDNPPLCNFFMPAVVRRGPLVISVSTSGTSPVAAKKIKEQLEDMFGPEYGVFLMMLGKLREQLKGRLATQQERRRFWESLLASDDLLTLIADGHIDEAEEKMQHAIDHAGT